MFANGALGVEHLGQCGFRFGALLRYANCGRDQGDQLGHDLGIRGRAAQAHGVHQQAQFSAGHYPGNRLEGKLQAHAQLIAWQIRQGQGEGFEEALEHRLVMHLEVFLDKRRGVAVHPAQETDK